MNVKKDLKLTVYLDFFFIILENYSYRLNKQNSFTKQKIISYNRKFKKIPLIAVV